MLKIFPPMHCRAMDKVVAQVSDPDSDLLYRRFPIGNMFPTPALSPNSKRVQAGSIAIQPVGTRLEPCATTLPTALQRSLVTIRTDPPYLFGWHRRSPWRSPKSETSREFKEENTET